MSTVRNESKAEKAQVEVRVEFTCPACGAEGYDETFDAEDIASATQVTIPCDECPARILLDVDVRIQTDGGA